MLNTTTKSLQINKGKINCRRSGTVDSYLGLPKQLTKIKNIKTLETLIADIHIRMF
ncbi:hypothetical protein Hanom_Chr10g00940881 [Helianthus anomalus]